MPVPWLIRLLLLLLCGGEAAGASPITNCAALLRLTPAEASQAIPVRVRGILTCYNISAQLCFVQDDTAGVYCYPSRWPADLEAGQEVEVTGESSSGRFSSIVNLAVIRPTGRRGSVEPKVVSLEQLNTGQYDSQWIEVRGVVQDQSDLRDVTRLDLWTGGSSAQVMIFGGQIAGTNLVNARIAARGVAGTFYRDGQLSGFGLFASTNGAIQVLAPPIPPFDAPERPIARPYFHSPDGGMDHRIRISGTVAAEWPGEALFVQDETGVIRVQRPSDGRLTPGDRVEVSGFLRDVSTVPWLANAEVRSRGSDAALAVIDRTESANTLSATSLIALEGTVLALSKTENQGFAMLDVRGRPVSVFAPELFHSLLVGSQVRLTGVWHSPPAVWSATSGPGVWLNSSDSMRVIAPPPSGAEGAGVSAVPQAFVIAGAFAGVAFFGWVALRKAARARTESENARSARELLSDAQNEMLRLSQSRERLGRDLHDHIIQSIYAVGLSLDDLARQVRGNPDHVEARLKSALADINGVIRELRNVILGLETNAIEPREFRTALKSLALALGHEKSNRMRFEIEQSAMESLTPLQATELIHIAREALSNSLRHGRAEITTFFLHQRDHLVRFAIEDDGVGFQPNSAERSGFGLRNMAKRAENLGAVFTVDARPGAGTRIVLDIPTQKQHFSLSESSSRPNR